MYVFKTQIKNPALLETVNESASADSPLQLGNTGDIFRTDCTLDVNRVRLHFLKVGDDVGVVVLHPVLFAVASEGEEVAAECVRVGRLRVVLALVQHIL